MDRLEATAFVNTDGTLAVVVPSTGDAAMATSATVTPPARGIVTLVTPAER